MLAINLSFSFYSTNSSGGARTSCRSSLLSGPRRQIMSFAELAIKFLAAFIFSCEQDTMVSHSVPVEWLHLAALKRRANSLHLPLPRSAVVCTHPPVCICGHRYNKTAHLTVSVVSNKSGVSRILGSDRHRQRNRTEGRRGGRGNLYGVRDVWRRMETERIVRYVSKRVPISAGKKRHNDLTSQGKG